SLVALMCVRGELDPLVLLGGDARDLGNTNVRAGEGPVAVVEADEYAEAFLQYEPRIAAITNIEADHLDYYGSADALRGAFRRFAERVQPDGVLLVCGDNAWARELGEERRAAGARVERYGIDDPDADWRAVKVKGNERGGLD